MDKVIRFFRRRNLKLRINPVYLIILIITIFVNIPLLKGETLLFWDTYSGPFQSFSIAYSEFFFHHHLPLWLPFTSFGMPEYLSAATLSIVSFFFLGVGKILNIYDPLTLFRYSLVGEQILAITGVYLLASELFKKKYVVLIVALSVLPSYFVYQQVQFNFRIIYLLPFTLYWIIKFFKQRSPEFFWLAGITAILSIPGSAIYPQIVVFYALAIFFLFLWFGDFEVLRSLLKPSVKNLLACLAFVAVAIAFLYYFKLFNDGLFVWRKDRASDLSVSLDVFLTNWRTWNPIDLLSSFVYGIYHAEISNPFEYTFYIGLLPLVGIVIALVYVSNRFFKAFLWASTFLYLFSLGGNLSAVAYYFPLINKARYVAILGAIPFRTLIVFLSGFGLDYQLDKSKLSHLIKILFALFLGLEFLRYFDSTSYYSQIFRNIQIYLPEYQLFLTKVFGYVALLGLFYVWTELIKRSPRWGKIVKQITIFCILVWFAFDILTFRADFETRVHLDNPTSPMSTESFLRIHPIEYQNERVIFSHDLRAYDLVQYSKPIQSAGPWLAESFYQFDKCVSSSYVDGEYQLISESLLPLQEVNFTIVPGKQPSENEMRVYACEMPKIRVVSNVLVLKNDLEVLNYIKDDGTDLSNLLVLSQHFSRVTSSLGNASIDPEISVLQFDTNSVSISVNLLSGQNGWLVYSDAYHPLWRAELNGREVNIERAYLGFKAVKLDAGYNTLRFTYGSWELNLAYYSVVLICVLASSVGFVGVFYTLIYPNTVQEVDASD